MNQRDYVLKFQIAETVIAHRARRFGSESAVPESAIQSRFPFCRRLRGEKNRNSERACRSTAKSWRIVMADRPGPSRSLYRENSAFVLVPSGPIEKRMKSLFAINSAMRSRSPPANGRRIKRGVSRIILQRCSRRHWPRQLGVHRCPQAG
jgi:hypothetical protein